MDPQGDRHMQQIPSTCNDKPELSPLRPKKVLIKSNTHNIDHLGLRVL